MLEHNHFPVEKTLELWRNGLVNKKKLMAGAGLFYCPYVPLQFIEKLKDDHKPKETFKTRYGDVVNPFSGENSNFKKLKC